MKRMIGFLLIALIALPCAAAASIREAGLDAVLATVNGVKILKRDIQSNNHLYASQMALAGADLSDEAVLERIAQRALLTRVQEEIMMQCAASLDLTAFTEVERVAQRAEAEAAYAETVKSYRASVDAAGRDQETLDAAITAFLTERGLTLEDYESRARKSAISRRLLSRAGEGITADEAEARAAYDRAVEAAAARYEAAPAVFSDDLLLGETVLVTPPGYRTVKHILLKPDQQALADELIARLKAGEDFDALLGEYGVDSGMKPGAPFAETGYYLCDGVQYFDPDFVAAALALEAPGAISAPVASSFGIHIIRYQGDVAPGVAPFEAVEAEITQAVIREKTQAAFEGMMADFAERSQIEFMA